MNSPYDFLKPKGIAFFNESDGSKNEADLMGFAFDEDSSYGMTQRIIEESREELVGVSSAGAIAILWFADGMLDAILDNVILRRDDGSVSRKEELDFQSLNPLDFIQLVLLPITRSEMQIGSEADGSAIEVTPARLCAAFALRMAYNGTRPYFFDDGDLRDYYLMQASVAFGLMMSFRQSRDVSVSSAVASVVKSRTAKERASARWESDPAAAAKALAIKLWPEAKRKGWTAERLWTAITSEGHKIKSDTVRKWMTELRKTGTC